MKSTDIVKASANSLNIYSFTAEALERLIEAVKEKQPCPTCEALARTVMLDQTAHDAQRKPWVGLTEEDIAETCGFGEYTTTSTRITLTHVARAIEAKLREKNR